MRSLVFVVVPHPVLSALWVFIASFGGQVEKMVGAVQHLNSARIGRVSVINIAQLVLVKRADSLALVDVHRNVGVIVELPTALNVLRSERDVVIKIEVVAGRRDPLELPSHPFLERGDLL